MNQPLAAGVIFVDQVDKIAKFYESVVGMQIVHADEDHVVLEIPGFQLTVHAIRSNGHDPAPSSYPAREDTCIKLCFPVPDLAKARAAAATFGGELWPPAQEWRARGFVACDGRDPEGNIFQLRQDAS